MRFPSLAAPVLVLCLLAAACEQPPSKEVAAAEASLAQARTDKADVFAPEQFREAQAALAEAERKVQAKDYRGALSSALDAAEKARAASIAAASARALARSAADLAMGEAQIALDEVAEIRAQATRAKVPDKAFEELLVPLAEAQAAVDALAKALADGDVLTAQKSATVLKTQVTPLPGLFRKARVQWDEQQKGRRARRR
jgi:hypothetical protein